MSKYVLKSNLSEKQIESDVSGFFGWMSKGTPFRLLDVDEQLTGADKKFYDSGFAFFMQYKVSNGLEPINRIPASTRKNRSALEGIREFRCKLCLQDDPSLYFGLRKMAKRATDFQHNILLGFTNQQSSQAFYVAPLRLDKDDYYSCLFDSVNRFRHHPYKNKRYRLYQKDWVSYVGHVPFLKEHVSIIPHERVSTHKHYYSYSQTGSDIGWHSPEVISEKPSRLSDVLVREISECINERKLQNIYELAESLIVRSDELYENIQDPIRRLQSWGQKIYLNSGVKMYLFLGNKEYIRSIEE